MKRLLFSLGLALVAFLSCSCESASPNYRTTREGTAYISREPVSQIDRSVQLQESMGRLNRSQIY